MSRFSQQVAWHIRSCTVPFLLELQFECIVWQIDSHNPSVNIPLSKCSWCTMSHWSTLFHCFDVLSRQIFRSLSDSNQFAVCLCDYIICPIRREKVFDVFRVGQYFALLLTLMRLRFERNSCGEPSGGEALIKNVTTEGRPFPVHHSYFTPIEMLPKNRKYKLSLVNQI